VSIEVDGLLFQITSDTTWHKYDDWSVYRKGIHKLKGTKGLDLIGISGHQLLLGEAKNFRGHRIQNKKKIGQGTLYVQTAHKLKDTLAGLVAISRGNSHARPVSRKALDQLLSGDGKRVIVFLYVDEDAPTSQSTFHRQRRKQQLDVHLKGLKNATTWFPARKFVFDRNSIPAGLGIAAVRDA
jgi:hypothetical protein